MENRYNIERKNIVLVGNKNAGKSTLFNELIGFQKSIVSNKEATTTDPVFKSMELIGYGAVKFVDTAGFNDNSAIGKLRVEKTKDEILLSDLILHIISLDELAFEYKDSKKEFLIFLKEKLTKISKDYKDLKKKYIFVFTKSDKNFSFKDELLKENFLLISNIDKNFWYDRLIKKIIEKLKEDCFEKGLLDGLVKEKDNVVLVVPIDTEAPEKRLILPQVEVIRECLDKNINVSITKPDCLSDCIKNLSKIDLVITDSQAFDIVSDILPKELRLTSFSILFARKKGNIDKFLQGAKYLKKLKDEDIVLISESCIHTKSHEDIGTVLIPNLILKKLGKKIKFEFSHGKFIKTDISKYSLIIQCGGCMMSKNDMQNRIKKAKENNVPITNYGIVLSYLKGVFDRATF